MDVRSWLLSTVSVLGLFVFLFLTSRNDDACRHSFRVIAFFISINALVGISMLMEFSFFRLLLHLLAVLLCLMMMVLLVRIFIQDVDRSK